MTVVYGQVPQALAMMMANETRFTKTSRMEPGLTLIMVERAL